MSPDAPEPNSMRRWCALARDACLAPAGIVFVSVACLLAEEARRLAHLDPAYGFLRWNLFLAWIPLVLAYALAIAARRDATRIAVPALTLAWILFLPNAPYLVTDLVHLRASVSISGIAVLGSLALAGLLIGVKSVQIVHRVIESELGVRAGWHAVHAVVGLIALGIYVGRVLRWNSWNVISHPRELVQSALTGPSESHRAQVGLLATIVFTVAFYVAYRLLTPSPIANDGALRRAGTSASSREAPSDKLRP